MTRYRITMSDALRDVQKHIEEASKVPNGHFFKAAYELPNKKGTIRFTAKGRGMSAPVTLWVKGPKEKDYEEFKTYKNMGAAKKEYKNLKAMAQVDEAKFKHPDAGVPLSVRRARKKKSAAQMKKDMNHADMLSKTNTGKAPVDYHRESEETIKEVSPPGWEGTIKAMKKDKDITNPWALGWWMKNRGYKSHKEEVEIDELSTDLLGRYKKRAAAQSSAASKAGYHKLAHKRYKGVNTATTLQFRNDAKKYDERQKKKNEEVDVDAFDYKAKKGAIAAPGSGSIAKPRKPKASDVNKSIEQQMADARKEEVTMEDMKWKVSLTGLPQFYMDGKSAAEVKLTLRKMLKRPDDILDIERTQLAKVRKDFRMRGQGKTEPEDNSE